nr:hypothetical protein [Tanacetum cinerariifolium]
MQQAACDDEQVPDAMEMPDAGVEREKDNAHGCPDDAEQGPAPGAMQRYEAKWCVAAGDEQIDRKMINLLHEHFGAAAHAVVDRRGAVQQHQRHAVHRNADDLPDITRHRRDDEHPDRTDRRQNRPDQMGPGVEFFSVIHPRTASLHSPSTSAQSGARKTRTAAGQHHADRRRAHTQKAGNLSGVHANRQSGSGGGGAADKYGQRAPGNSFTGKRPALSAVQARGSQPHALGRRLCAGGKGAETGAGRAQHHRADPAGGRFLSGAFQARCAVFTDRENSTAADHGPENPAQRAQHRFDSGLQHRPLLQTEKHGSGRRAGVAQRKRVSAGGVRTEDSDAGKRHLYAAEHGQLRRGLRPVAGAYRSRVRKPCAASAAAAEVPDAAAYWPGLPEGARARPQPAGVARGVPDVLEPAGPGLSRLHL